MKPLRKVLIANRGEISLRIQRACRELGMASVAVYSEADAHSPHVTDADEAVLLGPAPSHESYLHVPRLLEAARATGADAVHPGYGFLAENAAFAQAVVDAGLVFVGPTPTAIGAMGDKTRARRLAAEAGVPVVPAEEDPPRDTEALRQRAREIGFPLLIKAVAGGGGKGMRIVREEAQLAPEFGSAAREALGAFGDDRLFLERYVERPRHVEVQVLADHHGNLVHLGERECSIQRRHQKIVEESPSPAVDEALRARMTEAALRVARGVDYHGAGTVEFLLAPDGSFYFLEMNTRLQVEHAVTEMVTGLDLVQAQLRIAGGERLWFGQEDVRPRGHSIECRICAEDPAQQFLPAPGPILRLREPQGPGVRIDSGLREGLEVPLFYDPMLSKIAVWAEDREAAARRMAVALREYVILGCETAIPFLIDVLEHPSFRNGDTHTHFIADHFPAWQPRDRRLPAALVAAALDVLRPAGPVQGTTTTRETAPLPWQTLGRWRAGES